MKLQFDLYLLNQNNEVKQIKDKENLEIRLMQDGLAKRLRQLELNRKKEIQALNSIQLIHLILMYQLLNQLI